MRGALFVGNGSKPIRGYRVQARARQGQNKGTNKGTTEEAPMSPRARPDEEKARKTRQAGNFGRIRKLPSGRYQARFFGPDGLEHAAPATFEKDTAARRWLDGQRDVIQLAVQTGTEWKPPERERKARKPSTPDDGTPLFSEFAEYYLKTKRSSKGEELRPSTRQSYETSLKKHLTPTFGKMHLGSITPETVEQWHEKASLTVEPRALSKSYALLHAILEYAVEKRKIPANPARVRGAGQARPKQHPEALSVKELDDVIRAMPERYRAMAAIAGWCSLRYGEIAALTRRDIDLKRSVVKVTKGLAWVNGVTQGSPKTAAGIRTVPIPNIALPWICEHLDRFVGPASGSLLFPGSRSGRPLQPSVFRKYLMAATAAAGRPEITGPHQLRRAGLTIFAHAGATIAELQARAGHATPDAAMIYQAATTRRAAEMTTRMSQMATEELERERREAKQSAQQAPGRSKARGRDPEQGTAAEKVRPSTRARKGAN